MNTFMPLYIEKLSRFDRPQEPCRVAVPLPSGRLQQTDSVVVRDHGQALPTQCHVTGRWPNGSVKWLTVRTQVDLPGNAGKQLELDLTSRQTAPQPAEPVVVQAVDSGTQISTGNMQLTLGRPGQPLIHSAKLGSMSIQPGQCIGPTVVADSQQYLAQVGQSESGQAYPGWHVVHQGDLYVCLETRSRHQPVASASDAAAEQAGWLDFAVQVHVHAGKPWVELSYRIVNREAGDHVLLDAIAWDFRAPDNVQPDQVRTALGQSNYRTQIQSSQIGEPLEKLIDGEFLLYQANEQVAETHYGTFWANWCGPAGGVCVTHHQAHQNFPKAFTVSGQGLSARILPPDTVRLKLYRGMAKTHRLQLHLHEADATLEELDTRTLQYQMPDRPRLEAGAYQQAQVYPGIWPSCYDRQIESFLIKLADHRTRAYGIRHWGDGPDVGYTEQGRGRGELVWTNNEYDLPFAAMMMYARTGERRMLDYLLVSGQHQLDIDICHQSDDPLRHQGQVIHSADHVNHACCPSHQWVEGLLSLYHQTADPLALQAAVGIGENVLRHLEQRPKLLEPGAAATRITGWALRALVALYEQTHEARWLKPADRIAQQFQDWLDQHGGWLAPYTSHTQVRVPFMMAIAASSLMRYWRVTRRQAVADLIVAGVTDIVDHCLMPDGFFFYKELPSLQWRRAGQYVLEALAYAWELSGDPRFLQFGLPTFEALVAGEMEDDRVWSGGKQIVGDAVLVKRGPGPKQFAAIFMPAVTFYHALSQAGMLEGARPR